MIYGQKQDNLCLCEHGHGAKETKEIQFLCKISLLQSISSVR